MWIGLLKQYRQWVQAGGSPGMLGIGVGGTAEKAAVMAKESLMDPINIHELQDRGPQTRAEELRFEIFAAVNSLGIGAQTWWLNDSVRCQGERLPDACRIKTCCDDPKLRSDTSCPFRFGWIGPISKRLRHCLIGLKLPGDVGPSARRVNLDTLTHDEVRSRQPGETLIIEWCHVDRS